MLCSRKAVSSPMAPFSNTKLLNLYFPCYRIQHQKILTQSRQIGSIAKIEALGKDKQEESEEDDLLSSFTKRRGGRTKKGIEKMSPRDWLLSEEGLKFRNPIVGRTNWLGDDIPFPTNPWFKPKPPMSDKSRSKVYDSFKQRVRSFVQRHSLQTMSTYEKRRQEQILLRETSEQWGLCRDQISAIVRLKAMEDSWSLSNQVEGANDQNNNSTTTPDHRRTLQLNFEKGMESVLGVRSDQVTTRPSEDINELANRRLQRKSRFYGTQFVPLDSPPIEPISPESASEVKPQQPRNRQKYHELDEPTETRHVIGSDGIPRPSTCYISKPPGKIPMVFTDVSRFPRRPKPMSKAKAKYYPKTSLLPDYGTMQPIGSSSRLSSNRRSHCTIASSTTEINQTMLNKTLDATSKEDGAGKNEEEKKKILVTRLLRQLKGCSNSNNGMKLINQINKINQGGTKMNELIGLDVDEIKENLLIQASGLSFKTRGDKSIHQTYNNNKNNNNSMITTTTTTTTGRRRRYNQEEETNLIVSQEERQIRSIKFDMMKSIYLKKLELNSSGRLLLPESIRSKEERDLKILNNNQLSTSSSSSSTTTNTDTDTDTDMTKKTTVNYKLVNRSNKFISKCMKGPLGRLKQRQKLVSSLPWQQI